MNRQQFARRFADEVPASARVAKCAAGALVLAGIFLIGMQSASLAPDKQAGSTARVAAMESSQR